MTMMPTARRSARLARAVILFAAVAAYGAEIKVMTSGAFTSSYLELKSQFEQATQNHVATLTTTMGVGPDSIPNRLQRNEPVDVVIIDDTALDRLIADGKVMANSKVALVRSAIGMAVRAGAVKPDISSVDALKRTLLQARSIAYSASVSGDYLSIVLFQRLGIADQIASKSMRIEHERVGAVVARGEAEIGFQQVSELLPILGIDYVGPLPDEVQKVSVFSAGIATGSTNRDAATRFIRFLASPEAAPTIRKNGLEPVVRSSPAPAVHPGQSRIERLPHSVRRTE
jgi:molybdate transport system substrate-binding protein